MAQLYSQILGLSKLDVYSETGNNDNSYFDITGLPSILSYGKHPFAITFKDPENLPLLKNGSNVVFEFVDSRGTVIFSNLIDIDSLSGAGNGFIWIKKDPLRTADEIADGPAYFYVAGELGGKEIPNEWKGIYNIRSTFEYDIRKKYPNTSPIVLKTPNDIQLNSNFSESIDFDDADDVYKRSYVNVSASHMETNGGQVRFIELSYKESKSKSSEFKILSTYLVSGSTYEVSASVADGLNPISHEYKVPVPKDFRRDTPVTFKLRFLNPKSEVAQHYTASLANQDVEVTSSLLTFDGTPIFIEKSDNLLKGSMYTGNAVGKGFEQSGKSSAFLKTVDYEGFISASVGSGSAGVMFFSGSVLTSSGDDYKGVGLELHGGKGSSSFKFRSNPSVLEVKADTFFVGSETTQFISGSGGNIEISSSLFHLNPDTNTLTLSGSITATDGYIGNWQIVDGKLSGSNATLDAVGAALYMSNKGPDTDNSAPFDILRDEYYIDFTPADQGNTTNYYVKFGPNFAVDSTGILHASGAIFEGTVTASAGFIGGATIGDTSLAYSPYWRISSSANTSDSVSFISSSRFKVSAGGNITASSALLQGGLIDASPYWKIDRATDTSAGGFISSSAFKVSAGGNVTGSQVLFTGGKIGGWEIESDKIVNTQNTVELSTSTPGLNIKDAGGTERVSIKSGSFLTMGEGTQYIENRSFEDDTISAGRNIRSGSNILSWSFSMGGKASASLTDRSSYVDDNKAVSGDVTIDVVVPAGSGNYSSVNTYELSQVITASFVQGDTLSFSSVARFSSSFGGRGKDRALGPQYFRLEYSSSTSNGFQSFLPANDYTASNGYGEYFLGSGQYNSFGASAEMPETAAFVKLILTGSINDDTGYTIKKPLFAERKKNKDLGGKTFTKTIKGSTSAEYPETEITFDNFSLRSNTRKVEVTEKGLLIYNSEDSFFKMTAEGIDYRGGSGVTSIGSMTTRESFTNDSQVAGTLGAPALQGYEADPENIHATTAFDGNVGDYSKGNHRHVLPFSVIDSVVNGETITNLTATNLVNDSGSFSTRVTNNESIIKGKTILSQSAQIATEISGAFTTLSSSFSSRITTEEADSDFTAAGISGSWQGGISDGSLTSFSGSAASTGSFGGVYSAGVSRFAGNVGIKETNPAYALVVNAGNDLTAHFKNDGDRARIYLSDNDTSGYMIVQNSKFSIGQANSVSTSNLTIDGSGNVGIGITSPDSLLHAYGSSHFGYNTTHKHQFTGSLEISGSFLVNGGGVATVGGSDTQVQFNDSTSLGGDADFTYNKTTNKLSVLGGVSGSVSSTGSFGLLLQNGQSVASVGGADTNVLINTGGVISGSNDFVYDDSTGRVGIGTASPDRKLHVWKASAGTVEAVSYTELVVEDDGGSGISILAPDANSGNIVMGFPSDNDSVQLRGYYNSGNPRLAIELAASEKFNFIGNQLSGSASSTGSFGRVIADDVIIDNGNITIPATKKLYLDGGGDTYITEGSGNQIQFFTNGNLGFGQDATGHVFIQATDAFYYDGGSNTFRKEKSADVLVDTVGGVETLTLTTTAISGSSITTGSFGRVEVGKVIQRNPVVAHGMTGLGSTDTYFSTEMLHTSNGGVLIRGMSDAAAGIGIQMYGTIGVADPTDAVPAVEIRGSKANGASHQALGADETVFQIGNLGTDLVTVMGDGDVGIGTVSPGDKLHIVGGGIKLVGASYASSITLAGTDGVTDGSLYSINNTIGFLDAGGDWTIETVNDDRISFSLGASEKMRILNAGTVGIGTTSPDSTLHVVGDIRAIGDVIAENYIVSSSVTYSTMTFSSGSTQFGDTSDDTHQFTGSLLITGSENVITLPQQNIPATPTLAFGDGDTGFYESSDDVIRIATAGNHYYSIHSAAIQGNASNRFGIQLVTPTSTLPTFTPNYTDSNTGIGWSSADKLSLIAGGVGVEVTTTGISGSSTSTGSFGSVVAGGTGVNSFTGNVGIGTDSPDLKLHIQKSTSDAYTPTDFNDESLLLLKSPNADTNYSSIRFSNSAGNYEKFIGSVQVSSNTADIVFQGYDRAATAYKEYLRILENGNITFAGNISGSSTSTGSFGGLYSAGVSRFIGYVGINDSTPSYQLDVNGTGRFTDDLYVNDELHPYEIRPDGTGGVRLANSQGNIVAYLAPRATGAAASGIRIEDDFNSIYGSDNDYSIAYNATSDKLVISDGVDFATPILTLDSTHISGSSTSTGSFGAGYIDNKLGIGTTAPTAELVVAATDHPEIKLLKVGATSAYIRYQQTAGQLAIGGDSGISDGIYFNMYGNDGTGAAYADSVVFKNTGHVLFNRANAKISGSSSSTGSFGAGYIDNKLGIGTTSPDDKLHIYNSGANNYLKMDSAVGYSAGIQYADAGTTRWYVGHMNTAVHGFGWYDVASTSTVMFIASGSGKVGIGTTSPYYQLHTEFTDNTTALSGGSGGNWGGSGIRIENNSTTVDSMAIAHFRTSTDDWHIGSRFISTSPDKADFFFKHENSEKLTITNDGKVGIGTTSPDRMMEIEGSEAAIHLDSSANAFVLVDRGAASDVGQITYATAGSNKWFVGMADSDVSGLAGTEFFIGEGSGGDGDAHLVITDSGNVGIGGAGNPQHNLHLSGSGNVGFAVQSTGSAVGLFSEDTYGRSYLMLDDAVSGHSGFGSGTDYTSLMRQNAKTTLIAYGSTGGFEIGNYSSDEIDFITNNTRRMTIEAGGAVEVVGTLTLGGNISGSSTSTGSFGRVHVADDVRFGGPDTDGRIGYLAADGFGFDTQHNQLTFITNDQGDTNQAIVLGDTNPNSAGDDYTFFGIAGSTNAGGAWTKLLNLDGLGNLDLSGGVSGSATSTGSFGYGHFANNVTIHGSSVTMNAGSNDFHATARLAVYTPGGAGQPALYLDGGGDGDALHINAGNNDYDAAQYAIKVQDQNSSNVVFGVIKANTAEADDCYNMSISGQLTVGKETNHNTRFSTSGWADYIRIDAENSGGGGIVWNQQSTSKVSGILSNHGQLEIGYSTADDASAAWVPGITLTNGNLVGIGTTAPSQTLTVEGAISASGQLYCDDGITIKREGTGATSWGFFTSHFGVSDYGSLFLDSNLSTGNFYIRDSSDNVDFTVTGAGRVGIGTASPDYKLQVDGTIAPESDNDANLGTASLRWADVFAVQTTVGGIFESGLKTKSIGDNLTGTIVVWQEDKLIPCDKSEDELVMGVIKNGKDEPIVLGAEPVLVTGKVNVGDYIVTSNKIGHGKSVKRGYLLKKDLFGKVIAQALEKSDDSESCLIKCMIRKM